MAPRLQRTEITRWLRRHGRCVHVGPMRLAAAVLALCTSTAVAQPGASAGTWGQPGKSLAEPVPSEKSEALALGLAIGGTIAPLVVSAAGWHYGHEGTFLAGLALGTFGPSLGHYYAGNVGRGALMSTLRLGGIITMVVGEFEDHGRDDELLYKGIGAVVIVGTTLYDVLDAGPAARRSNEHRERALLLAPAMLPTRDGPAPGLALAGSF